MESEGEWGLGWRDGGGPPVEAWGHVTASVCVWKAVGGYRVMCRIVEGPPEEAGSGETAGPWMCGRGGGAGSGQTGNRWEPESRAGNSLWFRGRGWVGVGGRGCGTEGQAGEGRAEEKQQRGISKLHVVTTLTTPLPPHSRGRGYPSNWGSPIFP